jgi:hypothetical protein
MAPDVPTVVFQVLCGPFAGPGSQVMVASFFGPGNSGVTDWAFFVWNGGDWTLAVTRHEAGRFAAVGGDVRETMDIYRARDPRCCPKGGTRSRVWHWDGTRFVTGTWIAKLRVSQFYSPLKPSRNLWCGLENSSRFRGVRCQTGRPARGAKLTSNGKLRTCHGRYGCVGCICDEGNDVDLDFGTQVTIGRFTCLSLATGVRCTVTETGKGFLINNRGITRIDS